MAPGVGGPGKAAPQWGKRALYAVFSLAVVFAVLSLFSCGIGFWAAGR